MTKKSYPSDVLAQAQQAVVGWGEVDSMLTFGPVTIVALTKDVNAAAPLQAEIERLEIQLGEKRDQRDILFNNMWDKVKRMRSGIKATYGDDSQQYDKVGGTRTSDRKSPVRRVSTTEL